MANLLCSPDFNQIASASGKWGWDTDDWLDMKIELLVQPIAMGPGIFIRPITEGQSAGAPTPPPSYPAKPAKPQQHKSGIEDEEIPWRLADIVLISRVDRTTPVVPRWAIRTACGSASEGSTGNVLCP
jgi:hypothetical protein